MLAIELCHYLLILVLGFEKDANFKKNLYIFPTSTFFDKIKAHLWKYLKIDLNGSYSTT